MASEFFVTQAAVSPMRMQEGVTRFNKQVTSPSENAPIAPKQSDNTDVQDKNLFHESLSEEEGLLAFLDKKKEKETQLAEKLTRLNDFVQNLNRDLQFSVHKESGRTVVTVIDSNTEEIIRKIPSDEVLKIAESLENLSGLLLKEQA